MSTDGEKISGMTADINNLKESVSDMKDDIKEIKEKLDDNFNSFSSQVNDLKITIAYYVGGWAVISFILSIVASIIVAHYLH